MQRLEDMGRELEKRGKTDDIMRLAQSADGVKLGSMIDKAALEQAAKNGDTEKLKQLLQQVLSTEEGRRLADNVQRLMRD